MTGRTQRGDPVFEVRNVRMVLPGDASHFSRLVTCTSCGREVAGLPLISAADLEHAPGPFVCSDCVGALTTPGGDGTPSGVPAAPAHAEWDRRLEDLDRRLTAGAGEAGDRHDALERRLRTLEARVEKGVTAKEAASAALRQEIEELRAEVQTRLLEGLAEVRAAAAVPADIADRLQGLEKQGRQNQDELSELHELHAALDAGLGALRSEIGDVRSAVKRMADRQADIDDRLETYVRASLAPEETGKGRRPGRRGAEADRMTAVTTAVEDVLREQRQLKQEMARLAQTWDVTAAAASRATSQVSALSPLRSEIKLLRQEIAEHDEALDALRRTVEAQRRPAPARAPARKRAPAKKKE